MKVLWNHDWKFIKENVGAENTSGTADEMVTLPHTWNAIDGQDGGNDYYRGTCWYAKTFAKPELNEGEEAWLEFRGAAMTAEVWLNGRKLTRHEGGYSTFRVNITDALEPENTLAVSVDNGRNRNVYPQKADFTFYGGIYRDVYLLTVPAFHFALDYYGGPGIKVTPVVKGSLAEVTIEAFVTGQAETVCFSAAGQTQVSPVIDGHASALFIIEDVHLWDGVNDPYLYTASASLENGDTVTSDFGCRSFSIDPEKGFLLNGRPYPLCGAARHQDRQGLGNALTPAEHEEDIALMLEMGANTIRLAHYQHDQYFYDLCDKAGMIVWAEIPYITEHMPEGRGNTISQMTELVIQNYNHPSIVCWGLSNEITATGGVSEDLIENHKILNELCHRLDSTRPTTMAHVFMLDPDDPFVLLPDIRSYNLYYGWYVGDWDQNDEWFDDFHRKHPTDCIGLSEYGADANPVYQNCKPEKGDWSETYQAVYHEHMLKMWSERPYIWAMHCWNMFDFGADGRDEGGKPGQNQKGLVTFDRKIKKDAFYIYKAYLSRDPFVHLCGRRYADRTEEETEIKVYSNQPEVTLLIDGKEICSQTGDKIFKFVVPISGEHKVEAVSGALHDEMTIRKTDTPNEEYYKDKSVVLNWFDKEELPAPEGYYSIYVTMNELNMCPEAAAILKPLQAKAVEAYGDVAKDIRLPESVIQAMNRMTVEASLKQMGSMITPEIIKEVNHKLNQIKKVQ